MVATLIIVFREVLEAGLVIGIVMAASRGVPRRGLWISAGCAAGLVGAVIVAAFAGEISTFMEGVGQEIFNAGVLIAAVCMLGWHNIWMSKHGREMAADAAKLGKEVGSGVRPLYALATVCGIALLREGSEVALFLYGIAVGGGDSAWHMGLGGACGLAAGAVVGVAIYYGLLTIPVRHLFTTTSWLLLFLAAGMASQSAVFLSAANVLPSLGDRIWDTSSVLTERSVVGQVLHVLTGYTARPEGIQVVFFVATILVLGSLMRMKRGRAPVAIHKVHSGSPKVS